MRCIGWLVIGMAAISGQSFGQEPGKTATPRPSTELLVSFDDLVDQLDSKDLRILDVRLSEAYRAGHIPGAVNVNLAAIAQQASKPAGLADVEAWERLIAPLGLAEGQRIVIYDGKRQLDAARLWWLLGYLGVDRVALLDGGFNLWTREMRPLSGEPAKIEATAFVPNLREDRLASRDEVLAALKSGDHAIVDARSPKEYTGEEKSSKKGGHVPTAKNVEWSELVDKDGKFLPLDAIGAKLKAAGIDPDQPAITHCQGGGRSSVNAFVLERIGVPTRNYYLGWSEWGNTEICPAVTGKEAGVVETPK